VQALILAALALLLAACGAAANGSSCEGAGGPDVSGIQDQLLANINLEVDGAARIVEFRETSRDGDGEGDLQSCRVGFEGEIEFTGDCHYHMRERKMGERVPFEAEAEFIRDAAGWTRATVGIHPR
jgi:hypothetical protein